MPAVLQTLDGIDACARRLADEVRIYIAEHPSLKRISIMGHSMVSAAARQTCMGCMLAAHL